MAAVLSWLVVLVLLAFLLVVGLAVRSFGLVSLGLLLLFFLLPLHPIGPRLGIVLVIVLLGGFVVLFAKSEQIDRPDPDARALERFAAGQRAKTAAVAGFTRALTQAQADNTLSVHEKQLLLARQYSQSRARLQAVGQLTPAVEKALEDAYAAGMRSVGAVTGEVDQSLRQLAKHYDPKGQHEGGRIRRWFERKGFLWE